MKKNPNLKLKRWQAFVEESNVKMKYKPGNQNIVADALSRQYCNNIGNESNSIHSQQSSPTVDILTVANSINTFRNQIFLEQSDVNELHT